MKKTLLSLGILLIALFSCQNSTQNANSQQNTDTIITITIEQFDSLAPKLVNKTVKISGIVDHVCKHGGKKILLVSPNSDAQIHIFSDQRFSDTLTGNKVTVIASVEQSTIDLNYLDQKEKEIRSKHQHKTQEHYQEMLANIQHLRDSMNKLGVSELHSYWLKFLRFAKE